LSSFFQSPEGWENKFLLFKPPSLWSFAMTMLGNWYTISDLSCPQRSPLSRLCSYLHLGERGKKGYQRDRYIPTFFKF
jgi:hypothetical protein